MQRITVKEVKSSQQLTVDVLDDVDAETMSGDGGKHFSGALPPGNVVGGTPGGDGTEEQL